MDRQAQRDIRRKLNCLEFAQECGSNALAGRKFGVSKSSFYRWKAAYREKGEAGLINSRPCPENPALRTPARIEEKVLHLRRRYHFGPDRIAWYLERYHQIKISGKGVYYVLKRNGLNRLPQNCRKRSIPSYKRYEKQVPGHHIQVDVKFLTFIDKRGRKLKRFQYTAIDDATRIRALKIYPKHTQESAIRFVNYVIEKFPFRLHTIRTDNGHEFQAKFHWHLKDLGINHFYIRPATPRLNGKVERSHLTDKLEFYQLIDYKGDVDLAKKLRDWEAFYNFLRPHAALNGKTPYERLREKLVA
jgi:transposase InsO family protein